MKQIIAVTLLVLATVLFTTTQSPAADTKVDDRAVQQVITQIEHDWGKALVKRDQAVIDRITAPDWTMTAPDGFLQTKAEVDAEMKSGAVKFESFKIEELKVRVYGDTAIVHGLETEKSSYKGKDISGQYRFTDVFMKRDGQWRALATHVTRVENK